MTSQRETYGQAARERDLLRASIDLVVPKLVKARQLLAAMNSAWEADDLLRRAIHDLTVGSRLMLARPATASSSER